MINYVIMYYLHLCKSDQVWLSFSCSVTVQVGSWYFVTLFLQAAHTVSLSWQTCCHTAAVSLTSDTLLCLLCQPCPFTLPASHPPPEYHLILLHPPPPNCQGAVISFSAPVSPLCAHQYYSMKMWSHSVETHRSESNSIPHAFLFVYVCAQSLTASMYMSVFVREFRSPRVPMGFYSTACSLPPFAIQMSMYEASSQAEAALLIIPRTCKLT